MPALAIALGEIKYIIQSSTSFDLRRAKRIAGFLLAIGATLFLFYAQMMKNGFLYSLLCVMFFAGLLFFERSYIPVRQRIVLAFLGIVLVAVVGYLHIQQNASWKALIADAKIATQLDKNDDWRVYIESKALPRNELGQEVFATNYLRISWGIVGAQLSIENPLGYGLIEDSFARLAKQKWPDSIGLSHTHSGWLDLTLAFGFPGLILLLSLIVILMKQSSGMGAPWGNFIFWSLLSITLLWITTESAQTVTFAALVFWLSLCAGLAQIQKDESDNFT
jgi:O-antigen ligase